MNEELFVDFLTYKDILWTGINFAKAKFTKKGFDYPQEILQHYFHDWNMVILNDQKKYDIRMSFRKPVMQYDLSVVTKINKGLKASSILTKNIDLHDLLTEEMVVAYMKGFTMTNPQHYGLMFVVESFDAATKTASIWVVIYALQTGETALCEKFLLEPGGFGTRNYWARAFYNLLYNIRSTAFLRWENMVKGNDDNPEESAETN